MNTYPTVESLIAAETGNSGHVLYSREVEIGNTYVPASYRLEDVSSPTGGARRDVIGWFDGAELKPIRRT